MKNKVKYLLLCFLILSGNTFYAQNKKAVALHNEGNVYLEKNDYDNAIKKFQEAINIFPNYLKAIAGMAAAYRNQENREKSIECFQKIISIDPHCDMLIYHSLEIDFVALSRYDEAVDCCKDALRIDPYDTESLYMLGWLYFKIYDKPDEAIKCFEEVKRIDPEYDPYNVGFWIAEIYIKQNGTPNTGEEYLKLGKAYIDQRKYDDALKYLHVATIINPTDEDVYFNLGMIYHQIKKDYDTAIDYFTKVVDINPKHVNAHGFLKTLYSELGNLDKMREHDAKIKAIYKQNSNN